MSSLPLAARWEATSRATIRIGRRARWPPYDTVWKGESVRKLAILLVALSTLALAGCGSGLTVEMDSPVDIPEKIEAGGVTVQAPDEIGVGGVQVETGKDGRITAE